jgi:hypothetical protein
MSTLRPQLHTQYIPVSFASRRKFISPALPLLPGSNAAAIIKRVLLVLLVGVGLGTALFFAGLETLFPKY